MVRPAVPPAARFPLAWSCTLGESKSKEPRTTSASIKSTWRLLLPLNVAIAATTGNQPDCTANAAINKNLTIFEFLPQGCSGTACTGIRGLVTSTINTSPIPDGSVLYTCTVTISASAGFGTYFLTVANPVAIDPNGLAVSISVSDGTIVVRNETPAATATATQTPTQTLTPTRTPTVTPTPTSTPRLCVGDCNDDQSVTVNELITMVDIALGNAQSSACPHGVPSSSQVDIALILTAVNNALSGCGSSSTAATFVATDSMTASRLLQSATLLSNEQVLIAGGGVHHYRLQ